MGRCWCLRCKVRILYNYSSERRINEFAMKMKRAVAASSLEHPFTKTTYFPCLAEVSYLFPQNLTTETSLHLSTIFEELRKNGSRTTIVAAGSPGNCVVRLLEGLYCVRHHPHGNIPLYKDGQKKHEMGTGPKFKYIPELFI